MIIKILGSQSSFRGVSYNEDKIAEGKSEGLVAENFVFPEGTEPTKADYINYLKYHSSSNTKVKDKQFHAVISARGSEKTPKQLVEYAKLYLEKMGYGNNPYLIYFHNDTNNNHVHMVSTRIDGNGKKINDSFEKVKSQEILKEFGIDYGKHAKSVLEWARSYSISTPGQLISLLRTKDIAAKQNGDNISIYYQGKLFDSISVKDAVNSKPLSKKKSGQYKQIVGKYSLQLNYDDLKKHLHEKHGLEIVEHVAKGKTKPFGYTLIDHPTKTVLKGSEVFPLKALLEPLKRKELIEAVPSMLSEINYSALDWSGIKKEGDRIGVSFDKGGNVYLKMTNEKVSKISNSDIRDLWMNENRRVILESSAYSKDSSSALAQIFRVRDTEPLIDTNLDLMKYKNLVAIAIHHSKNGTREFLDKNNLVVYAVGNDQLLFDKNEGNAVLLKKDLDTDNRFESIYVEATEVSQKTLIKPEQPLTLQQSFGTNQTSLIDKLFAEESEVSEEDEPGKKNTNKKKRKNQSQSL
ncbi:relaxase/mobilization nuclease domain-containing protein [Flagellimonas flava]|uniref:relaxase/mobilization nuclease domain-containing protein n=1 Tax=Flagellimonas flava TaxID=570519 RepID=UPI003D655684